MRRSSCEFAAKCFTRAHAGAHLLPRIIAAASLPESSGSSEKYSKFRPQSGRLMFTPGEHHADALRHSLLAERASNGREARLSQLFAKRARRRKARRRNGAAKTQRVRNRSPACAGRAAVRHHLGRNAEPFHGLRVPEIPSGREPAFSLQRQLGNEIGVFHMRALPTL